MENILAKILSSKHAEVAASKRLRPLAEVESAARAAPAPRGFLAAIENKIAAGERALIAEIKRASPSRGVARIDFDPIALARAYAAGGATCLSVLTDTPFFQGSPDHLTSVLRAITLPVLRKDFIVDPYQVFESRALGADCVLIILSAVEDARARELESTAFSLGMDVLIETHNALELERALQLNSRLIGVNNRDLTTFQTTLNTSERLAPHVPKTRIVVSESGIFGPKDLDRLSQVGISAYLVGEVLMRAADVEAATKTLLSRSKTALGAS